MRWPAAIDLFSGAGGLSVGLRAARFRLIGAVELDPLAAETYRINFPSVRLWRSDIRTLDPKRVMEDLGIRPGELGLLAGCPPCQGFSTIRTRQGKTVRDPRNALVDDFIRFAAVLKPRTLMMENVPGLANYSRFKSALATLRRLGYSVQWEVRDAAQFGVPQRRKRLIMAGARSGADLLPDPGEHVSLTVRDAIGTLPKAGLSNDPLHDTPENRTARVKKIISRIPANGGSRSALGDHQLLCHQKTDGFKDVYGRMAWDAVAPTITGGCVNPSKGRFLHPEEDRAITLREALLLQGFPPGYQLSLDRGKFAAAAMIGNAIPPPLVAAHAQGLRPFALNDPLS